MKAKKYRYFELELKDGQKITAKAPQAKKNNSCLCLECYVSSCKSKKR